MSLSCCTEATFGHSDGRARDRPRHPQNKRQDGDSGEQPEPPHGSDEVHHYAAGVPEGERFTALSQENENHDMMVHVSIGMSTLSPI